MFSAMMSSPGSPCGIVFAPRGERSIGPWRDFADSDFAARAGIGGLLHGMQAVIRGRCYKGVWADRRGEEKRMKYFLIVAHDGTDAEAPARRQANRPAHLEHLEGMIARGEVVSGGPLLNDSGASIGSTMTVAFEGRAELDAWLAREPYIRTGVWQKVDVLPMGLVVPAPA
jgi:uncharacterized protein YciI